MEAKQKRKFRPNSNVTKTNVEEVTLSYPIEFAVWSVKERAARCRILGSGQELTLKE